MKDEIQEQEEMNVEGGGFAKLERIRRRKLIRSRIEKRK